MTEKEIQEKAKKAIELYTKEIELTMVAIADGAISGIPHTLVCGMYYLSILDGCTPEERAILECGARMLADALKKHTVGDA